jgi:hypothetical protein
MISMEDISVLAVALVFIVVGLINRAKRRAPWMAFLYGGIAIALMQIAKLVQHLMK